VHEPVSQRPRAPSRATVEDALAVGRRAFLSGERVDMQAIAAQLKVGRTTLYRWTGDRDQLLAEVIARLAEQTMVLSVESAAGTGAAKVVAVARRFMELTTTFGPLLRFLEQEPETALRLLMSTRGPVAQRIAAGIARAIETEREDDPTVGGTAPADALGDVLTQIGMAFCWGNVVAGADPDYDSAEAAMRVLLGQQPARP
jgi:AcrR family transcriptional regulator